jgi:N6-L-threonylcarbamoyladenine synthase
MIILGIESSCDDTSVALVKITEGEVVILAEKTASQIEVHKKYGGVVPEIAGRKHAENIMPVVEEVMKDQQKPDAIAVTSGPGLITGLLVGVEVAKTLSYLWDVPLVRVNHIEGHIHSVKINTQHSEFNIQHSKSLCLIASGGHTELILMHEPGKYERIGSTRDDAAGEAFDKIAKLLGLEYPGGPKISKFAEEGDPNAIAFPRPMLAADNFDFSFSGLKTAALYWLRDNPLSAMKLYPLQLPVGIAGQPREPITIHDFCASFEQAIVDVLVTKTIRAAKKYNAKTIILGGGVSANKKLRKTLETQIQQQLSDTTFYVPQPKYAMDNAAMIAVAGYEKAKHNKYTDWRELKADPNWKIEQN